jgi:hypothetical protein
MCQDGLHLIYGKDAVGLKGLEKGTVYGIVAFIFFYRRADER